MVVVLHNLRSTHNVGSIFRTSDAAGITKIYLCGITPAPVDSLGHPRSQLSKVSLGAEKSVAWEKTSQTWRLMDQLKSQGYTVFALEISKNSIPYYQTKVDNSQKVALVLGSETKGLPDSVLKRVDKTLEIPMKGQKESLNVSVAFGIVVFHLLTLPSTP